jgi:hypothetical protein
MRQKYVITINKESEEMLLQEYSEIDKDSFSLVCEEKYPLSAVQGAAELGTQMLVNEIRTRHFFPCGPFADKIAAGITTLLDQGNDATGEIVCDDVDYLTKKPVPEDRTVDIEDDETDVDDLIDDEFEGDFNDDMDSDEMEVAASIEGNDEDDEVDEEL